MSTLFPKPRLLRSWLIIGGERRGRIVKTSFTATLKKLRAERGLSQAQLGQRLFVDKSTVARWENGSRLPDATMIIRIARALAVDAGTLLSTMGESEKPHSMPTIIIVDDSKPVLIDSVSVMQQVIPNAEIMGFTWPQEALDYARTNRVDLAVLDIELGCASGLDLCRALIEANSRTNVVYLTAYPDYSLEAWDTEACGFMVKPLTPEGVRKQLKRLRYPLSTGGPRE